MEPFSYPKPVMPEHMRREQALMQAIDQALAAAMRGHGTAFYADQAQEMGKQVLRDRQDLTSAQRAAEDRYRLEVRKYNEAVAAYNAKLKDARQARVNARQVAKVRAAACPSCTMTHAGEC